MVSFTDNGPAFAATEISPGTSHTPITLDKDTLQRVQAAIEKARSMANIILS